MSIQHPVLGFEPRPLERKSPLKTNKPGLTPSLNFFLSYPNKHLYI